MTKSVPVQLEYYEGQWFSCFETTPSDFVFLGKEVDRVDITVFEGSETTCMETRQEGGVLALRIPLTADLFGQLEEDPSFTFEIVNDFENEKMPGLKFDQWIVKGRNWEKDVIVEADQNLEDQVMFSVRLPEPEEALAA